MRKAALLLATTYASLASLVCVAFATEGAAAHPPAYTMRAGFQTSLHNVAETEQREDCLDAPVSATQAKSATTCHEHGGILVAEGTSTQATIQLTVKIREYRHRNEAAARDLEALAKRVVARAPVEREIRLVAGTTAGRPAVEQWSVTSHCQRQVGGRVLVSLPDKIVEVEAVATTHLDDASIEQGIKQVSHVLHGVRIHRLGDVSVDPAATAPSEDELTDAVFNACM